MPVTTTVESLAMFGVGCFALGILAMVILAYAMVKR